MSSPRPTTERLGSTQTFDFAFTKLLQVQKRLTNKFNVTIIEPTADETVFGARFNVNDKQIVLLNPACDKDELDHTNDIGTNPLAKTLQKIRLLQAENPHRLYVIPLSETQPMFFRYGTRDHWVVLIIQGNDCSFFDPCSAGWFAMQASSIYPLGTMRRILAANNFVIKNETFLGWQKDTENCGRYCGAIVSEIAKIFFNHGQFANVTAGLEDVEPQPVEELIAEAQVSIADKLIFGNKLICDFRRQEFIPDTLTRKELMSPSYMAEPLSIALEDAIKKKFFEKGDKKNNLTQFINDFDRLKFKLMGKSFKELGGRGMTAESITSKLGLNSTADIDHIISAHNQGVFSYLPFILGFGIKEHDPLIIKITQSTDDQDYALRIIRLKHNSIKLICEYHRFVIKSFAGRKDKIVGYIEGPATVTFKLRKINEDWGWELETIETTNSDIKRMLKGAILPHQYFLTNSCDQNDTVTETPVNLNLNTTHFQAQEEAPKETKVTEQKQIETAEELLPLQQVEIELLKQTIHQLSSQLQSEQSLNSSLQNQIIKATKIITDSESAKLELRKQLESSLAQSTTHNTEVARQFNLAQHQLKEAEKRIAGFRKTQSEIVETKQQLIFLKKQHQDDITVHTTQISELRTQNSQLTQQITELQEQKAQLISQLADNRDINSKLTQQITELQEQKTQLTAQAVTSSATNFQLTQRLQHLQHSLASTELPKQPVYFYLAGAVLAGGLSLMSGLVALGTINFTLLATIPVAGWALATGFCVALAGMMLVKSIANALANRELATAPKEYKKPPSPSFTNILTATQQNSHGNSVRYDSNLSGRERLSFHAPNNDLHTITHASASLPSTEEKSCRM